MADEEVKLKYPKALFFIIINEFCERFCYYGMRGGIIADSWLGKFKTILYLSVVYTSGCAMLAIGAIDPLKMPQKEFTIGGLVLIAVGTGGIKPCVAAFGGDQFILPQQEALLATFFSVFYFSINAGSFLSTFLTPILRNDVHCLGNFDCYPLAFGLPGIMMCTALVFFILGRPLYRIAPRKDNIVVNVLKCIFYALTHRKVETEGNHWLDRSTQKFGPELVSDIKMFIKILILLIPLPIFWALFDQQGSGWTFQAVRMNGNCGAFNILPDQMQVANPFLILTLIPVFTYGVYPVLGKLHLLRKPLQRICCGGFVVAIAFAVSACVALALESTYPILPSAGEAQIRFYDATDCEYSYSTVGGEFPGSAINGYHLDMSVKIQTESLSVELQFTSDSNASHCGEREMKMVLDEKKAYGVYLTDDNQGSFVDRIKKGEDGYPLVRTIVSNSSVGVTYTHVKQGDPIVIEGGDVDLHKMVHIGEHLVEVAEQKVDFKAGGIYTVLYNLDKSTVKTIVVTQPNTVHILWLLPQYLLITIGEVMFSITGLEFAYSEAPLSMKSVIQACWLLTTAIGNLLVVFIEALGIFDKQSLNFFAYSGLMVATMLVFTVLAIRHKRVEPEGAATQ